MEVTTLTERQKTDPGVLPQHRALELAPADTDGVSTKRGASDRLGDHRSVNMGEGRPSSRERTRRHGDPSPTVVGNRDTSVAVLDRRGNPLQPTRPARARELLKKGRAVVVRVSPVFVIRLKDRDREDSVVDGVLIGVDPGSRFTGISVATEETVVASTGEVSTSRRGIWLGELVHRSLQIKNAMTARANLRRGRRSRNLRYRAPRFNNRTRPSGWLPPSLQHRVDTTMSWLRRLSRWFPVSDVVIERVRFDMQLLENPDISGVEYQNGTLAGTNVREYLLEKWNRICAYCDANGVPLNIDHIHPLSRGGSDRVSNLTLACIPCNQSKGALPVDEFVSEPARLRRILSSAKRPLRDAAAVNTTRYALVRSAETLGLPVETSSGAVTKWNRMRMDVPKTHALDALAVGDVDAITEWAAQTNVISCSGRGSYKRTMTDAHGFPRATRPRQKRHHGFATGDHALAIVTTGKKTGVYVGRVVVRSSGYFNIATTEGTIQGLHHRFFNLVQRSDGYGYTRRATS